MTREYKAKFEKQPTGQVICTEYRENGKKVDPQSTRDATGRKFLDWMDFQIDTIRRLGVEERLEIENYSITTTLKTD